MRAASQVFRLVWLKSLQTGALPPQVLEALMMVMQFANADFTVIYRWFKSLPKMRHWIGDRQAAKLEAEGFQLNQKPFESTIEAKRDDIMFDRLGGYLTAIRRMAAEAKLTPYRRMLEVVKDGFAGSSYTCFDGYPLFSNSHAFGDNDMGTDALTHSNLSTAISTMQQFIDAETNDSLLIQPTHLWYHLDLQPTVEDILDLDLISNAGGAEQTTSIRNKHFKRLKPMALDLGAGKTTWWGVASLQPGEELRPILWQYKPDSVDFQEMTGPTDEPNFMRRDLFYGTELWGAEACGFPMYIIGSQGS
jgi:phage major head subunit gpT-like protein